MAQQFDSPGLPAQPHRTNRAVIIAAIISCTVVILACIFALTIVTIAFVQNAPW